jgi:hypothetical protein
MIPRGYLATESKTDNPDNDDRPLTGYLSPDYAVSLAEFGNPRELPKCGGWILERQIPGFPYRDAMGCYPLFLCQDWRQLHTDLEGIGNNLVSLSLVTDPFGEYDARNLRRCFRDVVIPFKEHFVVDLRRPINDIVSRHHRKYVRRALRKVYVEKCEEPVQYLREWVALYNNLIERHDIKSIRAFSKTAFARQLSIPGMVMLRAIHHDVTVGAITWFKIGEVAYGHLAGVSEVGYKLGAAYALYWATIEYFSDKARWLDLGGGAGINNNGTDGLSFFKRGWSTGTRTAYFCGRIFDHNRYAKITQAKGISSSNYFPAYRLGEYA